MEKKRDYFIVWTLLVFLTSFITFLGALFNGFVIDDFRLIINNPFLTDINNIKTILSPFYFLSHHGLIGGARPVMLLSLMGDYFIWGMHYPFGYHFTNILIHSLTSALLCFTVFEVLAKTDKARRYKAVFAGFIFALHPIQAETVCVASFRGDILAAFFSVFAFFVFIKAGQIKDDTLKTVWFYFLSALFCALALMSKETAVILPFFLLFYALYVRRGKKIMPKKWGFMTGILLSLCAFIFFIFFWLERVKYPLYSIIFVNIKNNVSPLSSFAHYINTITFSFLHYVKTLFMPVNLSVDYLITLSNTVFNLKNIVFVVIAGWLLYFFIKVSKNYFVKIGAVFFIFAYLPVSNIVPMPNTVNDRYMYLPMIGFSMVLSGLVFNRIFASGKNFKHSKALLSIVVMAVCIAFMSYITLKRIPVFNNMYTVYSSALKNYPDNVRLQYNMAYVNMMAGFPERAIEGFKKVSAINPLYKRDDVWFLSGICYEAQNDFKNADKYYVKAILLNNKNPIYLTRYADMLFKVGKRDKALSILEEILKIYPQDATVYNNIGKFYFDLGESENAYKYFKKAIELDPVYREALFNMNLIYKKLFREAPSLKPELNDKK